MHFITWLYLIIETLHKLCTIIPRYFFIEEDFFQRKSKKWERNQYIKWNILKIVFGTWYNWLLFSKEPSTMAHHPSNQLINLIDNNTPHRERSPQIYMSSVRSPNSAPSNILSPLSTRENEFYIIKSSFVRN